MPLPRQHMNGQLGAIATRATPSPHRVHRRLLLAEVVAVYSDLRGQRVRSIDMQDGSWFNV